jgi:hypothetical protein
MVIVYKEDVAFRWYRTGTDKSPSRHGTAVSGPHGNPAIGCRMRVWSYPHRAASGCCGATEAMTTGCCKALRLRWSCRLLTPHRTGSIRV